MTNMSTILYLTQAVNYVIRQEKRLLVNHALMCPGVSTHHTNRLVRQNIKVQNIKAHKKRYNQNMNRRKHQIKQPGVDVQRKNIYRKGRN